jgi:uncharacterized protein (TIGR02118 family)
MTYSILIFAFRKPGTTPAEFKAHYEGSHVPLVKSIAGPLFPISHIRTYLHRTDSDEYPASVLVGGQADFQYDAFAELTFKDEAAFGAFFGTVSSPENAAKIAADEELFLDRSKMTVVLVGDRTSTSGDA